jgi:DNA invertase Pin-like site-specific DNA recombinase
MTKIKKVALYARVSTGSQTVENQLRELRAVAERHGWHIAAEFTDAGISGAKGREKRPGLDKLLQGVARRDFDMVAAWSVDRLGRSLMNLLSICNELQAKNVDLYLHQQALDTSTPSGRAMFGMCGVFAQFERELIRERVNAGLAKAKAEGKQLGRPRLDDANRVAQITKLREQGMGKRKIAKTLGIGVSVVQRAVNEQRSSVAGG